MPLLPFGSAPSKGGSSPLTTKGDLFGFSTVNARLPVLSSPNGVPLQGDSAQSLGVGYGTTSYNLNGQTLSSAPSPTVSTSLNTFADNGTPTIGASGTPIINSFLAAPTIAGAGTLSSIIRGFYANPTVTGAYAGELTGMESQVLCNGSGTQLISYGVVAGVQANGSSTVTNAIGVLSSLQTNGGTFSTAKCFDTSVLNFSGTITTAIGLKIENLGGATNWGFQVGNYQSYHQGPLLLGATAFPTTTSNGLTLATTTAALISNGSYTATAGASAALFAAWLLNDSITTASGANPNTEYAGLATFPLFTLSDGRSDQTVAGILCTPKYAGTNTVGTAYGLWLNAAVTASVTSLTGVASNLNVTGGTTATATGFKFVPFAFGGTITTLVGLDLTATTSAGTAWGFKVAAAYQNYIAGKTTFGATGTPTNTIDIQGGLLNYLLTGGPAYVSGGTTAFGSIGNNVLSITTATGNSTFTITAAKAGTPLYLIIINDATSARTITFGAGFKVTTGTLVGTPSKQWIVHFISDGTNFCEVSRTGPQ